MLTSMTSSVVSPSYHFSKMIKYEHLLAFCCTQNCQLLKCHGHFFQDIYISSRSLSDNLEINFSCFMGNIMNLVFTYQRLLHLYIHGTLGRYNLHECIQPTHFRHYLAHTFQAFFKIKCIEYNYTIIVTHIHWLHIGEIKMVKSQVCHVSKIIRVCIKSIVCDCTYSVGVQHAVCVTYFMTLYYTCGTQAGQLPMRHQDIAAVTSQTL